MLTDRHFPYSSMQEINLDWILTKVKNILRFVPDDGSVGQILRRTAHGAEWSNEQGGGGAVNSVNGQTGDVVLDASDVGALPDTTVIPDSTSDLVNDSGFVDAAGAAAAAPVQKVNGQTGTVTINKTSVGLGNVANVLQYSASNPPPYPVTSVNGQTGAVVDVDYIVEQSTSGIWTYRKWNSGIVEAWMHIRESTINMTSAEGSGYYAPLNTYLFPTSLFISISAIEKATSLRGALGDFTISDYSVDDVSGYWWATKSTSRQPDLWLYVIGTWK